jgi:hypothetical protein
VATAELVPNTNTLEIKDYNQLCVMDDSGDSRIQWDQSNQEEVAKAEARFNELKKKGFMAYSVNKKGDKGTVLNSFDPTAERIIMHSQMIGG